MGGGRKGKEGEREGERLMSNTSSFTTITATIHVLTPQRPPFPHFNLFFDIYTLTYSHTLILIDPLCDSLLGCRCCRSRRHDHLDTKEGGREAGRREGRDGGRDGSEGGEWSWALRIWSG